MTLIKVIDVAEAEGALREAYDEVASTRGEVGNILKSAQFARGRVELENE